ncbi:hypothetical protein NDU88_000675 [Pleurodeles waltl]|uniref:Uncharacterized protein n=1 Tax=Pleurodeles waltl TaxID=8319 RepID=A0AAV7R8I4_PLEWA|nr:hypothetical protein NDU88_000675 [Pleurodeles waltl]
MRVCADAVPYISNYGVHAFHFGAQGWSRPCARHIIHWRRGGYWNPRIDRRRRTERREDGLKFCARLRDQRREDKEASGARRSNSVPRGTLSVPHTCRAEVLCCRPEARTASASCTHSWKKKCRKGTITVTAEAAP